MGTHITPRDVGFSYSPCKLLYSDVAFVFSCVAGFSHDFQIFHDLSLNKKKMNFRKLCGNKNQFNYSDQKFNDNLAYRII